MKLRMGIGSTPTRFRQNKGLRRIAIRLQSVSGCLEVRSLRQVGVPSAPLLRALETFKALGIEFSSYSEQMDTTPTGKMGLCGAGRGRWSVV